MDFGKIEDEIELLDNAIAAAEQWSDEYSKDPSSHAGLIKVESKIERNMRGYFRDLALRIDEHIDWSAYEAKVKTIKADDLEIIVTVDDVFVDREDSVVMQTVFDPVAAGIALGIDAGETVYEVELGLSQTSATVQKAARELVAGLVGKRIDPEGNIIDNPNAKYRISDTTRDDIRESIRTSMSIGENKDDAAFRLKNVINNPKRAQMIAQTEAVNAYQEGLLIVGRESGATGKQWLSINPNDICGIYAALGIVPLEYVYDTSRGLKKPTAHPWCRCSMRLVYKNEFDK